MNTVVERMTRSPRTVLRLVMGVLMMAIVAGLALRTLDWRAAWQAVSGAEPGYLALALVAMLANIALKVVRWRWLFHPASSTLDDRRLLGALMVGQLGNVLLPARLGDAARLVAVTQQGHAEAAPAALTLVIEKAADSLMLLLALAALLPFVALGRWLSRVQVGLSILLVAMLFALMALAGRGPLYRLLARLARRLPLRPLAYGALRLLRAASSLHVLRSPRAQWHVWALSMAIWALSGAVNWLGFAAVHLALPFAAGMLLAVTEIAGNNVAYAPAGIGVYHSICILTLSLYGVAYEPALSAAIVLHFVVYVPIITGGLAAVWLGGAAMPGLVHGRPTERTHR